jgi:hypothetical protein
MANADQLANVEFLPRKLFALLAQFLRSAAITR